MRALVTGGAGLIGSHIADRLVADGWRVRVVDALEPITHRDGAPAWLNRAAEFVRGDVRDRAMWSAALRDVDVVFHQAAYGGYMPEIAKYIEVNSVGTALMLETIRDERLPIRKVIVASSQAVYPEGAGRCPDHGVVSPRVRDVARLQSRDFAARCPLCDRTVSSVATPEHTPVGGESPYAVSKLDQERLTLLWSRQVGIPAVALRYSCTYGPRQSVFNAYTGVIAIFCTRLLNGLAPLLYEDGAQTRDFVYVEDVAAANAFVAGSDVLDGQAVNVGSGSAISIRGLALMLAMHLKVDLQPQLCGAYRPGEIRDLVSDTTLLRRAGWAPRTTLFEGTARYLDWVATLGDVREYFAAADSVLRTTGGVRALATAASG